MASSGWRSGTTVAEVLAEHGGRFGFYQAVRLLARSAGRTGLSAAARDSLNEGRSISDAVQFSAEVGDGFRGSEIGSVDFLKDAGLVDIKTNGWGIAGPNGPLPQPYGQWVLSNSAEGDSAMEAFLNIFNHQVNVLRYLIRSRTHLNLNDAPPEDARWAQYLAAVQGLSEHAFESLLDRKLPRAAHLLGFGGVLSDRHVSLPHVCNALSALLRLPVQLHSFRGEWLPLPNGERAQLRNRGADRLGAGKVLGQRVWQQHAGVTFEIGPLDWDTFNRLLPLPTMGNRHAELRALSLYTTDRRWTLAFRLVLDEDAIEATRLAKDQRDSGRARLGLNTWLPGRHAESDRSVSFVVRPD